MCHSEYHLDKWSGNKYRHKHNVQIQYEISVDLTEKSNYFMINNMACINKLNVYQFTCHIFVFVVQHALDQEPSPCEMQKWNWNRVTGHNILRIVCLSQQYYAAKLIVFVRILSSKPFTVNDSETDKRATYMHYSVPRLLLLHQIGPPHANNILFACKIYSMLLYACQLLMVPSRMVML